MAALLERARKETNVTFKEVVNQALRQGLRQMAAPVKVRKPYRASSVSSGIQLQQPSSAWQGKKPLTCKKRGAKLALSPFSRSNF